MTDTRQDTDTTTAPATHWSAADAAALAAAWSNLEADWASVSVTPAPAVTSKPRPAPYDEDTRPTYYPEI